MCVCEPSCACTRGCGLGVGIRYVFVCLRSSVLFCAWRLSVLVSVYMCVCACVVCLGVCQKAWQGHPNG